MTGSEGTPNTQDGPQAYLVIYEEGGLAGAFLDEDRALQCARATESVVVAVPIVADYRPEHRRG